MDYVLAVVGSSGLVGQAFLNLLSNKNFKVKDLRLFGNDSVGSTICFKSKEYNVKPLSNGCFDGCDFIFLFCSAKVSEICIEIAKSSKGIVIDNSSLKRMDKNVPLIVPEINANAIGNSKIIANPNCTTAICALPLFAINKQYEIESIEFCTYQAVSGCGKIGLQDLCNTRNGETPKFFKYNVSETCIPKIDEVGEQNYTFEEWKMVNETKKIFNNYSLKIGATCIRVPVANCHAVSVFVKLKNEFLLDNIKQALCNEREIIVLDDLKNDIYPISTLANGKTEVFVGRIRECLYDKTALLFYVLSDNLLRGAAYNAYLIMEYLINRNNDSL